MSYSPRLISYGSVSTAGQDAARTAFWMHPGGYNRTRTNSAIYEENPTPDAPLQSAK
ncbi:hypothetical protein ABN584_10870 [Gloeocapsa sp. BRSZ]